MWQGKGAWDGGNKLWGRDEEIWGGEEWKIRAILVGYLYRSILASVRMFWSSWSREGPLLLGNLRTCFWVEHGSQRALPASADSTEPPGQDDRYAKVAYGVACSEVLQPLEPRTSVITIKGHVGTENVTHNLLRLINTGEGPLLSISRYLLVSDGRKQRTVSGVSNKGKNVVGESCTQCVRLMGFMAPEQTDIQILVGELLPISSKAQA